MGIGISVFLIAVGAVLTFALHATQGGFNFDAIGIILMAVGAIGLVVALIIGASANRGGSDVTVVERGHDHY